MAPKTLLFSGLIRPQFRTPWHLTRLPKHTTFIRHRLGRRGSRIQAKKSLEKVSLAGHRLFASLSRLGTLNKSRGIVVRTGRGGNLVGYFVQSHLHHA